MKISTITGNHPRHLYLINEINKYHNISGCLIVKREQILPPMPNIVDKQDKINFIRHFYERNETEKKYFGRQKTPSCEIQQSLIEEMNSKKSARFINRIKPDVVLVFGSGLIKEPLLSVLPKFTLNLHLGLSPRYRGAATLFWPFYNLEPNWAGSTLHYIVAEPDAGDVVHQTVPELSEEDGIHDVACKTVYQSGRDLIKILDTFHQKKSFRSYKQRSTGKKYLQSDFRPEHLRVIYNLFNNDVVKQFIKGTIKPKTPKLFQQFK